MYGKYLFIAGLIMMLVFALGCEADPVSDDEPDELVEPEYAMGRVEELLPVDGSDSGYPSAPLEVAGAVIHLAHDGESIYVHLEAEAEGWIAVGFNSSGGGMNGANMVLGYFAEGDTPSYRDDVGRGHRHSEAGISAVEQFYLKRTEGVTTMELSHPLSFPGGEGYNVEEIAPGETYSLIVAVHRSSDNIDSQHSDRGRIDFQVQP